MLRSYGVSVNCMYHAYPMAVSSGKNGASGAGSLLQNTKPSTVSGESGTRVSCAGLCGLRVYTSPARTRPMNHAA